MSHKQKQPIKQLLKDHYSEQRLRPDQLATLLEMQSQTVNTTAETVAHVIKPWHKRLLPPAALTACLLITSVAFYTAFYPAANGQNLVNEIAANHLQPLQLDVGSSSLEEVNLNLNHLSFALVNSERMESKQWTLLGGRYCTLQGQLAAQLKLLNKQSQKIVTLYQSAISSESKAIFDGKTLRSDTGVDISIWWEDGVMLALAQ